MKFNEWAEQRREDRQDEELADRVSAKFETWLMHNLHGKSVKDVSADQVIKTMEGIIRAESGELQGTGQRPVVTPKKSAAAVRRLPA